MRASLTSLLFLLAAGLTSSLQAQPNLEDHLMLVGFQPGGSYLGIGLAEMTADRAHELKMDDAQGVEITRVEDGSPAAKAGLKGGDVLLSYNSQPLLGAEELGRFVRETPVGRRVKVDIWRDGKLQHLTIVTGERRNVLMRPQMDALQDQMSRLQSMPMPDMPSPVMTWRSSTLGADCEALNSQLAEFFGVKEGVLVRSVAKGSAADKAGLKAGDVLTKVGGKAVINPREVSLALRLQRDGDKAVPVIVTRDHRQMNLAIVPGVETRVFEDSHSVGYPTHQ